MDLRYAMAVAVLTAIPLLQRWARKRRSAKRLVEAPALVTAYGLDERTRCVELGPVSISQGLDLVEDRYAFAGQFFEQAEEAMAKTTIGLQRDSDHYIEIHLIDSALITIRAGRGITDEDHEEQVELNDIGAVRDLVTAYHGRPRDFGDYWRGLDNRAWC